ncbi:RRM domain-containing protein [Pleurotus pulmonarius]
MSDLDADLYGDLYGNDEAEFADPGSNENEVKTTAEPTEAATTTTQTTGTTSKQAQSGNDTASTAGTSAPAATQPSAIPTSASPVPQQIPTYEQPQPSDYQSLGGDPGQYQNIPVTERSIRPSEMKDEGKMFIGGLNWDTTDESLRDYFTQFGKVDACTIMRDAAGRSRCFAFLTFEEPASVNAVMVREHFLDGKIIDPKRAIPRQEHQRATKLFIGGLPGSVTSESMREYFSQYGKVIDSTVMLDRETGRSKGFGFISFEDTNVQPILGFGNLQIDGKLIDVKLAQPRYQRDNYQEGQGGEYNAQGGGGGGRNFGGQGNFNNGMTAAATGAGAGATGAAPNAGAFDPQALAALYTRMMQMAGGGNMNPAMMGGMGGMRAGMGMNMGGMGGMGMGAGMGMGMGAGGMNMGMGGGAAGAGAAGNPNIPRGPRGGSGGPPGVPGNAGVGPQRAGQRGQHNYHPYSR